MHHAVKHDSMQWHAVATRLSISFAYACSPVGSVLTKLVPILLRLLRRALRATPSGGCRRAAPFVVELSWPQPHVPQSARGASSAVAPRDPVGALLSRIWASRRRNSFGIGACSWSSVPAAAHISHSQCVRISMIVATVVQILIRHRPRVSIKEHCGAEFNQTRTTCINQWLALYKLMGWFASQDLRKPR